MKKYDVITVGAATRDVFLRSKQMKIVQDASFSTGEAECFALGSKIEVDDIVFETGGGATNTAVGFARQRLTTAFIGRIGHRDARGREILQALRDEGVATELVATDRRLMTGYSAILLTHRGERTVLVYRGASGDFRSADIAWPKVRAKWLYVSSMAGSLPVLKKLWSHAAEHKIKIAWNPGGGELRLGWKVLAPLLSQSAVFMVNQEEAAMLAGVARDQVDQAFAKLRTVVGGITVITMGTDGSLAGDATTAWRAGTNPVRVVDTTGAGDAFGCGFVGQYIRRPHDLPGAMKFASANSESVVQAIGAKSGLIKTMKYKAVPVIPYIPPR